MRKPMSKRRSIIRFKREIQKRLFCLLLNQKVVLSEEELKSATRKVINGLEYDGHIKPKPFKIDIFVKREPTVQLIEVKAVI